MLARVRGRPLRHWEDPALLHVVHQDLLRKKEWADFRAVSLVLPPCACCRQDLAEGEGEGREEHQSGPASPGHADAGARRCGNTAYGIAGTVREDERNGDGDGDGDVPEAGLAKVVFAVNAGCPIPTRRFGDVVAAAEQHLGLLECAHQQKTEARENQEGHLSCVLAAFCDGSSIIYYTVSSGIDTS
eukprot:g10137.t1